MLDSWGEGGGDDDGLEMAVAVWMGGFCVL